MSIMKRVFFFLATNLAIILTISIIIALLETIFGFHISSYGFDYFGLFVFALIVGFTGSFISLFMSKWIARKTYGIELIDENNLSNLGKRELFIYHTIKSIADRNNLKTPEIWIYASPEANAFATGATKNNSLVAISTGLLNKMNQDEIEWVIAHEMSHIINGDMVTMTLLQWILNTFVIFLARIIAGIVDSAGTKKEEDYTPSWTYQLVSIAMEMILWILASIIVMWFSRKREFKADEGSAKLVGKEKMISALKALEKMYSITPSDKESGKLATFQISSRTISASQIFASHPPLEERIQNLEQLKI